MGRHEYLPRYCPHRPFAHLMTHFFTSSRSRLAFFLPPPPPFPQNQISLVMDKFESQFTDLDVQTSYMESTMSNTTATTTPQDQVDLLMAQVADEAGLEIQHELGGSVPNAIAATKEKEKPEPEVEDRLADRLVTHSLDL